MKPPVKTPAFITIFLLFSILSGAQIRQLLPTAIATDVRKVINDYPNRFEHITGDMIIQNPQSTDYQCNFKVEGAEECTITRYSSKQQNVSSWQALMLTTDDFDAAKKKFRSLYSQINNLAVGSMRLNGSYEAPVDSKKFTSVLFTCSPAAASMERLRVELAMEAVGMDWKVRLIIYDIDREDSEQGPTTEGD